MYHQSTLSNGLRVVTHDMKQRESVSLAFWIASGGRFEEDRIKGIAHFLEHMLFKGSKKYSCIQIKELIEGVGGSLNAFTSEEQTCYYAKIPSKHLKSTFDILADMIFNPLIDKKDIEKERTVIIEEIKMYRDLPQYLVMELLDGLLWPGHPLGKALTGTIESVSSMTRDDLKDFHKRHYSVNNIVLAAAGDLMHERIVQLVSKNLKGIKKSRPVDCLPADNSQANPRVKCFHKDIEQMHLALGMIGLNEEHKDKFVLSLLNIILGGNMSSRLFSEVRETRGLAYSISTSAKALKDTGVFMVRAGVDNNKIVEAVEVILKELNKIKKQGITPSELVRAQDYLLGQIRLGLEDTLEHMLWIGETLISLDKLYTLKEVIEKVKKIGLSDVKRVANDILKANRFNLAVVGPISDIQQNELGKLLDVSN